MELSPLQDAWLRHLYGQLRLSDLLSLSQTCKGLREATSSSEVWEACVHAQSLPQHAAYLLRQPDVRRAALSHLRASACLLGEGKPAATLTKNDPPVNFQLVELLPAGDGLLVWTRGVLGVYTLQGQACWQLRQEEMNSLRQIDAPMASPCGTWIAMATYWGPDMAQSKVQLFDARDGRKGPEWPLPEQALAAAWCPGAAVLAVLLKNGELLRLQPGQPIQQLQPGDLDHTLRLCLAWSTEGSYLASSSQTVISVFTQAGAWQACVMLPEGAAIGDTAWSSDGRQLAVSSLETGAGVVFYQAPGFEQIAALPLRQACARLAWAGDRLVAVCDCVLSVYSTAEGSFGVALFTCKSNELYLHYFSRVRFSPCGAFICALTSSGAFRVVCCRTSRLLLSEQRPDPLPAAGCLWFNQMWSPSGTQLLLWLEGWCRLLRLDV